MGAGDRRFKSGQPHHISEGLLNGDIDGELVAPVNLRGRALAFSLFAAGSIMVIEGVSGLMTGSLALLGDAAHGGYDVLITALLLISSHIAVRPPDHNHTYGHMKFESLGTLVAVLLMVGMASMIVVNAIGRLFVGGTAIKYVNVGFLALGYAIAIHASRIVILGVTVREAGGLAVKADLIHASSDFLSTIVAALGFYLATLGLREADAFAGLVLAGALAFLSLRLSKQAVEELSDAAPWGLREELIGIVKSADKVLGCRSLRVRRVGDEFFVEVVIMLPKHMDLKEAHEVASKVEEMIKRRLGKAYVTVHFEPE